MPTRYAFFEHFTLRSSGFVMSNVYVSTTCCVAVMLLLKILVAVKGKAASFLRRSVFAKHHEAAVLFGLEVDVVAAIRLIILHVPVALVVVVVVIIVVLTL